MSGPGMGMRQGRVVPEDAPPIDRNTFRRVVRQFRPYRGQVTLVVVLIGLTSGLGVVNPILLQVLFDTALFVPGGPDLPRLGILVSIMAALPVVIGLLGLAQTYHATTVGQRVMRDLRSQLYEHLQTLSLRFYTGTRTGEIQSRLANDVGGVQSVLTTTVSSVLANIVTFVSSLVAMLVLSWQLTLVSVVLVPVFFWLTRWVGERRRVVARATQEALADMSAITQETLSVSGILLSRLFGRQGSELARYAARSDGLARLEVRQQMIGQSFFTSVQVFLALTPAGVYLVAGFLLADGDSGVSAGTIVAFTALQTRLYFPIGQLLQVAVELRSSLALFDRIFGYLDLVPDIVDEPDALWLDRDQIHGDVALRNVHFTYPEASAAARPALDGVTLRAHAGQLVALVGPSGAGKTTISYLIPRLYDVDAGRVELDGHDVRDLTLGTLAGAIGYVTQESYLFHATIRENLVYGRPDATEEQLVAAAEAAYIHERILEFPEGYDTVVGERGYRLSGAERQRLAIARVLLHDPRVLVLDEATSALDTASERMVQRVLEQLVGGRTTIAIAHRLSTVVAADVIYVIDDSRVVEQGTHRELLDAGGLYQALYREQFADGRVQSMCADGVVLADGTVVQSGGPRAVAA